MDFEVELAVVMGAFASHVAHDQALDYVAGYTILNDLSARELQFDVQPAQTTFAKSMDGFCPLGPWLVTADEVPDPQNLDIQCLVNGQVMQHATTAMMIFSIPELIAYVSTYTILRPGDVIVTGTPGGVGNKRNPQIFMKPGDVCEIVVDAIGTLRNGIRDDV